MPIVPERNVSGRFFVGIFIALAVVLGGAAMFARPFQEAVLQETRPRTLREPIGEGAGWQAIGRFDGEANCVELRVGERLLDRACTPPNRPVGDREVDATKVTRVPDGTVVAYGTASEQLGAVNVVLEAGTTITVPVKAGELGFPVGFWAVALPDGARLHEVVPTAQ